MSGRRVARRAARRVVSLVPSITEALAGADRTALVGATDWCSHPADLDVRRVRGTKNPDLAAIRALRPDVVVAVQEENRELDVRRLRDAGVEVWVARIETVPDAFAAYDELFDDVLGWPRPAWLEPARERWCGDLPPVRGRVVVPVWRDPWMVVGRDTFTGDLLRRLGWENAFGSGHGADGRYPHVTPEQVDAAGADLAVLPDEPYVFTADDGPEALATPSVLVSGRLLTWYGPSLLPAHPTLSAALSAAHTAAHTGP